MTRGVTLSAGYNVSYAMWLAILVHKYIHLTSKEEEIVYFYDYHVIVNVGEIVGLYTYIYSMAMVA